MALTNQFVAREYDLTGSEVHASGKVAVISGHNCSFIPFSAWACDHQEEALFPLQAWGQDYVVSITQPLRSEPNVLRVLSGADGNQIHFEPAVQPDVTLNRGDMVEFEASEDFRVTGSDALLVAQFLVGQDYAGINTAGPMGLGDPSLTDEQLLDAMMAHPILINRPIVVTPKGVRLCRPSETVIDILPPQHGEFVKEDGERIVDGHGRRVATA